VGLKGISATEGATGPDALSGAGLAVVRVEPDGVSGLVMFGGPHAPAGKVYRLVDSGIDRGIPLDAILAGRPQRGDEKHVPRTAPGDVIVFSLARAHGHDLSCGAVVARMHDGMAGPVQALHVLARPGPLSVTKLGAIQSVRLADPAAAKVVGTAKDMETFAAAMSARPWPGGQLGFILRDASMPFAKMGEERARVAHEVAPDDKESMAAFLRRLVVDNEILKDGPVEAIPTWRMPLSVAHMFREGIDLKVPQREPRVGAVGRHYKLDGSRQSLGYQPSFVVLADDDEWAFGARSGRKVRTCMALQPLGTGSAINKAAMASAVRDRDRLGKERRPHRCTSLFADAAAVERAALGRAERRGDPPAAPEAKPAAARPAEGAPAQAKSLFPHRARPAEGTTPRPAPVLPRPRMPPPPRPPRVPGM